MGNNPPPAYQDAVNDLRQMKPVDIAQPLMSSYSSGWPGVDLAVARLNAVQDHTLIPEVLSAWDSIILHLDNPVDLKQRFEGRVKKERSIPGGLCLIPKEAPMQFSWTEESTSMYLNLAPSLLPGLVEQLGRGDPAHIQIVEQFNFHDPFIQQIGNALLAELQTGGLGTRLYIESLAQVLGIHLLRNFASVSRLAALPNGRLSAAQLRQVIAYVDDHLGQNIGLSELAAQVGFSPSHFARVFKQTTHLAPHQYVIQRRLERARELLSHPGMTVAQVAQQVGFYDQSHLIRHFKRAFGVLPKSNLHD